MTAKECNDDLDCVIENLPPPYPCHKVWEESVIWAVVIIILDLAVNVFDKYDSR
jgi:hypothetical protein